MDHNATFNTTDIERVLPIRGVSLFAAISFASYSCLGALCNLITIAALLKSQLRGLTTTKFVVNLAICDFLMCAIPFPLYAQQYASERLIYPYQDVFLQVMILRWVVGSSSLDFLIAITVNRYVKICQEEFYDTIFSKRNVWIMIAAVWIFRLVFGLIFVNGGLVQLKPSGDHHERNIFGNHMAISLIFMAQVFVPPPILIGCSVAMVLRLKKMGREMNSFGLNSNHDSRLVKISIAIVICYVVCLMPSYTLTIFDRLLGISKTQSILFENCDLMLFVLVGANAVVNPFVYVFMSESYRHTFYELFRSLRRTDAQIAVAFSSEMTKTDNISHSKT